MASDGCGGSGGRRVTPGRVCWYSPAAFSFWECFALCWARIEPLIGFGGITLAIVMLVPRTGPAWRVAFHRFAEVSVGIGLALILTAV
jgi:hypothetical protein